MARRISLTLRVSSIVSIFVAVLLAAIIAVIGFSLNASLEELVMADNEQIARARALQLGELMDKLHWQIRMISIRNQFKTGDAKTIESAVLDLNGKLSPEVVGAFYVWPGGDYMTTEGARSNVVDRDYYKAVLVQGADSAVSEAVISKALNVPIVVTAVAVKGADRKTRGMIAFQFKLEKLSEIVSGIKVGRTGYGWIIDNKGLMIAHRDKDLVMKLNATAADKEGYIGMDAMAKNAIAKESGTGSYIAADGSEMTVFHVKVPNSPGWTMGISVPSREINETAHVLVRLLITIAAISVVLSIFVAIIIARSITKPVNTIVQGLGLLSVGDLALTGFDFEATKKIIARQDELGNAGRSLDVMLKALIKVVNEIRTASGQVSSGSEQLSSTAQGLSQGANEQAASVEELSASVEELASTIKQNADNTHQADALSRRVAQNADESGKAVLETVMSMKEIAARISIIEEIASQTNLLALNAAIEAARAGETGKGFAVVASEVRKLAERSSKAAGEINELSKKSVTVAGEAGKRLEELVPDIRKTAELIQEIAAASSEQSSGADQIAKGVSQMDQVVQQNASSSEELAATAEELSAQATKLVEVIGFFKTGEPRSAAAPHPARKDGEEVGVAVKEEPRTVAPVRPVKKATAIVPKDSEDTDFEEF